MGKQLGGRSLASRSSRIREAGSHYFTSHCNTRIFFILIRPRCTLTSVSREEGGQAHRRSACLFSHLHGTRAQHIVFFEDRPRPASSRLRRQRTKIACNKACINLMVAFAHEATRHNDSTKAETESRKSHSNGSKRLITDNGKTQGKKKL